MSKGVGFRPKLLPPHGRQLQRSYKPLVTCFTVSGCIAVLIFVIFGLTAFNIYHHRFGRMEHKYHTHDEVSLSRAGKDLSSVFCTGYSMQPEGVADFYLLPHEAEVDPSKRVNLTFSMTAVPGREFIVKRVHYLNAESTVSLSACRNRSSDVVEATADMPAEFLVIVGDNNYEEWLKYFNSRHVPHKVLIPKDAACGNSTSLPHLDFVVHHSANFFFLLVTHHHIPFVRQGTGGITVTGHQGIGNITLTGHISQSQYNISGALSKCNASETSCLFPLSWGSRRDVVAQVHGNGESTDAPASFFTDCQERKWFWIPIFGVLPVVIVVLTSVWCWCLLVKQRSLRSRYHLPDSSQASHTSYGSMNEESTLFIAEAPPRPGEDEDGRASIQE